MNQHPIYDAVVSKLRHDPFKTDRRYITATKKHNKHRRALKEVADEHYGPREIDQGTST